MQQDRQLGMHGLMLLVAIIWGISWAVGRILATGLPPMTGAWLRYIVTTLLFYIWFAIQYSQGQPVKWLPAEKKSWKTLIIIATTGVLFYQAFFMHGMMYTAAGDASLIITFNPIFTVLLAAPMLGQHISRRMFIGLMCGFIGVFVVTGWSPNTDLPADERIFGNLLVLIASLSWAFTTNMTKRMMERRKGEEEATALQIVVWYSLLGTLMLTPFAAMDAWQHGIPEPKMEDWYAILYLGSLSTVLAYYWFAMGIEKLGATAASSYVFLVPVFGVLGGVGLLGEKIGWTLLIGFLMIVAGVRVVQSESERLRTG